MVENSSNSDNIKVNMILDAAQKRFGYYGLAKTTMTEIAQDVGLSKASLYYYFTDKDALFRAVVKREQDGFIEEMKKMFLVNDSAENKLLKYVNNRHEYFMMIYTNLGKLKMSFNAVKPLLQDLLDTFFYSEVSLISEILNEGIDKSEFESIDVPVHADMFISVMNGLRKITIKENNSNMLEEKDFEQIETRVKSFSTVFIKGILKK